MVEETKSRLHVAGVIALYWTVSISLVYTNKFIVTNQPVPLFITWCQCSVTCLICWVCGALGEFGRNRDGRGKNNEDASDSDEDMPRDSYFEFLTEFPKAQYKSDVAMKVMPLSIIFVVMIIANQFTLKNVQVSFYNVARSLTIVFNAIFSIVILKSNVSTLTVMCLVVVILGFVVGVGGEVALSTTGVGWGLVSSVAVSLNSIYTKKALSHVQNDAWRLTFVNNANACFLFIPLVLQFEGVTIIKDFNTLFTNGFMVNLAISGGLGFMMGIVSVMQIRATSPLTHNISGTAKAGFQSAAAFYIWGNAVTFMACLGIVLVLLGSSLYTCVKIYESPGSRPKKDVMLPK